MRKEIIDELAVKYKLAPHIIERIVKSQFRFVAHVMRSKTLEPVRLHHLGVFGVKPGKLKYLKDNKCIEDTNS